jgi:hypothetical protein
MLHEIIDTGIRHKNQNNRVNQTELGLEQHKQYRRHQKNHREQEKLDKDMNNDKQKKQDPAVLG